MPFIHITSSIPASSIQVDEVVLLLSKSVAEALGRSEAFVMAKLELDTPMSFAGSLEVCTRRLSYAHFLLS